MPTIPFERLIQEDFYELWPDQATESDCLKTNKKLTNQTACWWVAFLWGDLSIGKITRCEKWPWVAAAIHFCGRVGALPVWRVNSAGFYTPSGFFGSFSTGLHWGEKCFVAYDKTMAGYFVHAVICIAHLCTGHKSALFIRNMCEYIRAVKTYGH